MEDIQQKYEKLLRNARYLESFLPKDIDEPARVNKRTVWKSDLKGFTEITQRKLQEGKMATDAWTNRIGEIYTIFDLLENQYEGTIKYYEGDAGVAVFKNPTNAVYGAAEIAREILALPEETANKKEIKLSVRQGMATGTIFSGVVEDGQRRINVVGGPALEHAYKLEEESKPGKIWIDETTRQIIEDPSLQFRRVAEHTYELSQEAPVCVTTKQPQPLQHPENKKWYEEQIPKLEARIKHLLGFFPPLTREIIFTQTTGGMEHATLMFGYLPTLRSLARHHEEDPQKLTEAYQTHFETLRELEKQFNGEIDKLYRTVFIARFRSRVDYAGEKHEHYEAARETAVQLDKWLRQNEHLKELLEEAELEYKSPRIGVAHGEVYVGPLGTRQRRTFTMLGNHVNLAARLMKKAIDDDEQVLMTIPEGAEYIGKMPFKGIEEPVAVYRPIKPAKGLTKRATKKTLVGRDNEIKKLTEIINQESKIAHIIADAGYGKTELTKKTEEIYIQNINKNVYRASAAQQAKDTPEYLLQDLVRNALGITTADPETRKKLEKITDEENRRIAHHWLGLSYEKPVQTGKQLEEARRKLLLELIGQEKSLLIFNDIHWADEKSLQTIQWLHEQLPQARILTNYRPREKTKDKEFREIAEQILTGEKIELGELSEQGTTQLTEHLINAVPDEKLARFVLQQSKGIPLYIEEVVNYLLNNQFIQNGTLIKTAEITIPDSIEKLVLERYRQIKEPEQQEVLQYAACMFGETFPKRLLEEALGKAQGEIDHAIHALEKADFLRTHNGTIEFKHNLVKNAIYETAIRPIPRARAHTKIGDSRKKLYGDGEDQLTALAWDYEHGDDDDKATEYLWKAQKWFTDNQQNKTGLTYGEKLEQRINKITTPTTQHKYIYGLAQNAKGLAYQRLRKNQKALQAFEAGFQISNELPESLKDELQLKLHVNSFLLYLNDLEKSKPHYEAGVVLAKKTGNKYLESLIKVNAGMEFKGEEKIKTIQEAIALSEPLGDSYILGLAYNNLADALIKKGEILQAKQAAEKAIKIADRLRHTELRGTARFGLGRTYVHTKDYQKAMELYQEAENLLKQIDEPLIHALYEDWIELCDKIKNEELKKELEKRKSALSQNE
ncbi:MAG: adenylate/guanylate cyclase domain-containing protein [Candidatus Woesearchaeota archaeon]